MSAGVTWHWWQKELIGKVAYAAYVKSLSEGGVTIEKTWDDLDRETRHAWAAAGEAATLRAQQFDVVRVHE